MLPKNAAATILHAIGKKFRPQKALYKKAGLNWLDMKILKHLPDNQYNEVKLLGRRIRVFGRTGFLDALREIFFEDMYRINLPQAPFIIDCGANIGLSVIYLKQHYPDARIIAFEPDSKNFDLLKNNIAAFSLKDVSLRQEAVWSENTILHFSNDGTMSSRITGEGMHQVKAVRLADLLTTPIDFLKIDIEGAEYTVMNDIADRLHLVKNLFVEYHGTFEQNEELLAILQIMRDSGFSFYIKEAAAVFANPFTLQKPAHVPYDLQLNIFGIRQ